MSRCRCRSGKQAKRCCGPYHAGRPAPTPQALMRSRYAAYAAGLVDYILATTDPAGPMWQADEAAWRAQIADFSRRCTFLGVDITEASSSGDDGQVTFHAKLRAGDDDVSFTETSRFRRVGERWFYVGAV